MTKYIVAACMRMFLPILSLAVASRASAETPEDFFSKNRLEIFFFTDGNDSYGAHARLLSKYLTQHIPGNPGVLFRFMPGGSGIPVANYLQEVAGRGGNQFAILPKYIVVTQAIGVKGVRYDMRKLRFIGSSGPLTSVLALWNATSKVKSIDDMKHTEVVLGTSGRSSPTYIIPTLMNNFLGTRFKLVMGYRTMGAIMNAIEQGEVVGRAADFEGIKVGRPHWLRDNLVTLYAQEGTRRDKEMPDVPALLELVSAGPDREIVEFFASAATLGRIYVAPPEVPADRLAALRKGFADASADPAYLADLQKVNMAIDPSTHVELEQIVERTLSASPRVLDYARQLLGTD
jgi:tripartite-type tricarboxylate transporter receptor subunit TctC